MSKYTPGPWRTDPDLGHEQVLGPDGIIVADCSIFAMVKNGSTPERNRANARLIAAAPELLELLEQHVTSTGHDRDCRSLLGIGRPCNCVMPETIAIIAKAKGED